MMHSRYSPGLLLAPPAVRGARCPPWWRRATTASAAASGTRHSCAAAPSGHSAAAASWRRPWRRGGKTGSRNPVCVFVLLINNDIHLSQLWRLKAKLWSRQIPCVKTHFLTDSCLLTVTSRGGGTRKLSVVSLTRALIPFMRALPSRANHS